MIRTGVDWSGDPGEPSRNPRDNGWLVIVATHLDETGFSAFESEVSLLKANLYLHPDHVFKHMKSADDTRIRYMNMLATSQLRATALCIDKRAWDPANLARTSGPQQTINALMACLLDMRHDDMAGQVMLIDIDRSERAFLRNIRTELNRACRALGRESFRKIAPRPDHRSDALLIQTADMIAGDLYR